MLTVHMKYSFAILLVKMSLKSGPKITIILTNTLIIETKLCEWARVEAERKNNTVKNFAVKQ